MHPAPSNPRHNSAPSEDAVISVIIPCRNEEESLPQLLQELQNQTDVTLQIIVADGGSDDATASRAQHYGADVCTSEAGRGLQMNTGVKLARYPWLCFLHADSRLSSAQQLADALRHIQQARQNTGAIAGHFALEFFDKPAKQKRWQVLEYKSTTQLPLTINGDQGLFIHHDYFQKLGGFDDEFGFLEDQKIAHKIHQTGRWTLLPHSLQTSTRRFQTEGFQQRYWLMTLIMLAWLGGLKAFLSPAQTYPEQRHSKRLKLSDHIRRFLALSWQLPIGHRIRLYWNIADVARTNLYQPFIWLDAQLGLKSWPLSRCWLNTGQALLTFPAVRQLTQLLLLPVFPIIATSLLLAAKIADQFTHPSASN